MMMLKKRLHKIHLNKKAQIAIEYVMITGALVFLLAGIIYSYGHFSSQNKDTEIVKKSENIAKGLAATINEVYLYGKGSKQVYEANFPYGINSITAANSGEYSEISFGVTDSKNFQSDIAIITNVKSPTIIVIDPTYFSPQPPITFINSGNKKILVKYDESTNPDRIYVCLIGTSGCD